MAYKLAMGRGFDDLPTQVLERLAETLVGELSRDVLLKALGKTVDGLLRNSEEVREIALKLEPRLHDLALENLSNGPPSGTIQ